MPLASASFQAVGDKEYLLHLAPATRTGFLGVQEVGDGCYQAKIHRKKGSGFVSLPASKSVFIAAWTFAKAFEAREQGTLDSPTFKASFKEVRSHPPFLPQHH